MRSAIAGAVLTLLAGATQAQQTELGRIEYMSNCAQCHGIDATGNGVIAQYLTTAPPDLTVLQRENAGVFPFREVYDMIEGGGEIGPHGTRDMPIWGDRYAVEAQQILGFRLDPAESAAYVESRILALIAYLSDLQQE